MHTVLRLIRSSLILALVGLAAAAPASAAIIINAPMNDTNSTGWVLGGNPTSALLTGNGTIDPVGNGWLRMTNATGNQTGFAYNTTIFDLSAGLLIEFDYATWGGNGADGYSVYLFDAGVSPFNIGAFGGSLGYAQKLSTAACNPVTPSVAGISGGYVGIGVDEFGNFAYGCEGRYQGAAQRANTVTIRGSVVGFGGGAIGQTLNATSYPWLATSANNGALWYNGTPRPSQTGANYRKVRIQISPAPNPVANVWIAYGYGSPLIYTQMITSQALPAISTSQQLMVGYAASTGGSTNYHEIRNLLVSDQATTSGIDLAITKTFTDVTSGSTTTASVGDAIRFTVIASNTGPNNVTATGVGIQDIIPAIITGATWTCAGSGGAMCGAASGSGNTIDTTANLPLNGYVTYTITGTVGTGAPSLLSNTASLVIPGSITDYNSNNNTATVNIPVNSNLSTSTKTWTDPNGGDQDPGDVVPYTITLQETANAEASGVTVTDTFPATLTNLAVTSCPSGTCTIVGQVLTVSNVSVPANGSVSIIVSTTIAGGTAVGTLIDNCAMITNPSGVGDTPCASTVTVSASAIPAQGNKPLYLYDATSVPAYKLSRTPMAVTPAAFVAIPRGNTTWTWTLNPALQSSVTITTNIPVDLWLSTNSTRNYDIPVTLRCGAVVVATQTQTIALTNGAAPALFHFNLPLAAAYICPAGSWILTVANTQGAGVGLRDIRVYPAPAAGSYSRAVLPSQNVINVNSVAVYDAAYPGGSGIVTTLTGTTVYVRSVISDPFGSYDIASASIIITDSTGSVRVNGAAMTQVADSGAATKTYQYAYAVPAGGPAGNWTVRVTGAEGTEGTVTDLAQTALNVVIPMPSITAVKAVSTYSDPYNNTTNPKSIPGAVMLYTVTVVNSGLGPVDADSMAVTDPISTNTIMCVSALCSNPPVAFTCSAVPACGLTYNYAAAVTYTNQPGGAGPYNYTPVPDAGGFDAAVTGFRVNPAGAFNGVGGPPYSQFTLQFRVKVK